MFFFFSVQECELISVLQNLLLLNKLYYYTTIIIGWINTCYTFHSSIKISLTFLPRIFPLCIFFYCFACQEIVLLYIIFFVYSFFTASPAKGKFWCILYSFCILFYCLVCQEIILVYIVFFVYSLI